MDTHPVAEQARHQLEDVIFPFWLERGIDPQFGGFLTCFDNRGRRLLSTHKFTWSQGRFVWVLARAAGLAQQGLLDLDPERLLAAARRGAEFLSEHAIRDDGTCAYVLDEAGQAVPDQAGERSVYADCFVAIGLAELARQTGESDWLDTAAPIIDRATVDIVDGTAPTLPYPVPPEYVAFGPRMILLNTRAEQVRALAALSGPALAERAALAAARADMLEHRLPDGTFAEMIRRDGTHSDALFERHRTPGHALEGIWMILEAGDALGEEASEWADLIASANALCGAAWDPEYGGLLRYVGPEPASEPTGSGDGSFENLIRTTWDTKLWWVHTEAAYTTALLAERYGDAELAAWFDRIWAYTLATFPGGVDGEEWIQIRDRRGRPLDEVVALPVKDPFHITRNLMQLLELNPAGLSRN